jgi:hypothetical protein
MNKEDLKKGTVYLWYGANGADGANILFSPAEDGDVYYHPKGSIVLHWSGNRFSSEDKPTYKTNESSLKNTTVASDKATKYFDDCVEAGKDVGGFSWHDSNDSRK